MNSFQNRQKSTSLHHSDKLTLSSRRLGNFHLSRNIVVGVSICLFAVTITLCILGKWGIDHAEQSKSWPLALGRVTDLQKHEHRGEYVTYETYSCTIIYAVDGQQYDKKVGKRLRTPVDVFYNPDNPGDYVLQPGVVSDGTDTSFFAAAFFGFLGLAVLAIGFSPRSD